MNFKQFCFKDECPLILNKKINKTCTVVKKVYYFFSQGYIEHNNYYLNIGLALVNWLKLNLALMIVPKISLLKHSCI